MDHPHLSLRRRQILQTALGFGACLTLPGMLAGCRPRSDGALLLTVEGTWPARWLKRLPAGWHSQRSATATALLARLQPSASTAAAPLSPALVGLADGWATAQPLSTWRPLDAEAGGLLSRLADWATEATRLFAPSPAPSRALPWSFTPWVLVLRSRPDLAARASEGWSLLLDPSLRKRLVLPSSPRVCMELMQRDFAQIQGLRRQVLAHDDRHGLNLLLGGQAQAAVLPLRGLIPLLRRDQRLQVLLPVSGAPLSWQMLLQPASPEGDPAPSLPLAWMGEILEAPLLPDLLRDGWVPPLPRSQLEPALERLPRALSSLLLPPEEVLQRCWSLPPLSIAEQLTLQTQWDAAGES